MDSNHLDGPRTELIIEQDDGHHYHQGQKCGGQDVNDQGLLTQLGIRFPILQHILHLGSNFERVKKKKKRERDISSAH